jgi:hypothetical protein
VPPSFRPDLLLGTFHFSGLRLKLGLKLRYLSLRQRGHIEKSGRCVGGGGWGGGVEGMVCVAAGGWGFSGG